MTLSLSLLCLLLPVLARGSAETDAARLLPDSLPLFDAPVFCRKFASTCASWKTPAERAHRSSVIARNAAEARAASTPTVTYGMTPFSHLSFDEFSAA